MLIASVVDAYKYLPRPSATPKLSKLRQLPTLPSAGEENLIKFSKSLRWLSLNHLGGCLGSRALYDVVLPYGFAYGTNPSP